MTPKELYELVSTDVEAFARFFFPHLLYKKSPAFHSKIYKDLGTHHPFLAYEIFRGGAKSTIGLIIKPIHFALHTKTGDISLISKSEQFVLNEITRRIKFEFEHNVDLIACYGDMRTSKWSESYFVLKNGIAFEGTGIAGQLRGGRRGLIVLDDLEDEESAQSEEQRDKLKRRIGKELIPKLLPDAQMVYFGTPVSPLCYLHQIITTPDNGWKKRVFPAYKDQVQEAGKELWSEMFPHDRLQQIKKAMGSNYFSAEYLCNPISDETVPIKEHQIRYWKELPHQYSGVIAVDPAYSDDLTADYKVASLIIIDQTMNRYLVHYIRTHNSIGEFQEAIINLWQSNRNFITALGIPHAGAEKAFYDSFLKKCEERKIYPPITELKNVFTDPRTDVSRRSKKGRVVAALQPLFEQGKYYIHADHLEARDELLTIGSSRWDDLVDSMAYAEQILQPIYYDLKQTEDYKREEEKIDKGTTGYGEGL